MRWGKAFTAALLCILVIFVVSCGSHDSGAGNSPSATKHDEGKVLNFFNWPDYIGSDTIPSFEKLSGNKVRVSYFDSTEIAESRVSRPSIDVAGSGE
jgi:spermidine/putrescine-binding protein